MSANPDDTQPAPAMPEEIPADLTVDEKFSLLAGALMQSTSLPVLEPRRDVLFVAYENPALIYSRRDTFLERFGDDFRKAGAYGLIDDLLKEIPKAEAFKSGKLLPVILAVGLEVRLAFVITKTQTVPMASSPEYAGPRSSTKYPTDEDEGKKPS